MQTGSSETAPFGGSTALSSVAEMASTSTSPSAGETMAHGTRPLTAVGLVVSLIRMQPTAPATAELAAMSKKVAEASPAFLMSAMRPLTAAGYGPAGSFTRAYRCAMEPAAGSGVPAIG